MAAGIKYDLKPLESEKEMCRFETVYRLSGGFNLADANLVENSQLPPLTPLCIDFKTRKAVAVKNVKVAEAITVEATSIKVEKKSLAYIGMLIGNGSKGAKISAIDKTNEAYDVITTEAALGATAKSGDVLFEASAIGGTTPKNKANLLNYAWTKIEAGATITAIGRVFEIKESKLIVPVSEKDKENLGDRFMFI